jgi:hypothetical protein
MTQQLVLPEEELERKKEAIRYLSLGLLIAAGIGQFIILFIWLFNREFPVVPAILVATATMLASLVAFWLGRRGRVLAAGYFYIITEVILCSTITFLFGGVAGPIAICYAFPILAAGVIIGVKSTFLVATLSSILLLVTLGIEISGFFPQVVAGEWE